MNSPFGRLSLWILIAIAVLLLGGCVQHGGNAFLEHPVSHPPNNTIALLPVPRVGMFDQPWLPDAEEISPPAANGAPNMPPPQQPMPAGIGPQSQDRVAARQVSTSRTAQRPRRQSQHTGQPPMAHHPAYPH